MAGKKEEKPAPFTEEELGRAATAEQMELQGAQLGYLLQRCGDLRANLNRALQENEDLKAELTRITELLPKDLQAKAKKKK